MSYGVLGTKQISEIKEDKASIQQSQSPTKIQLACLMILRDEEENLSKNLPLWIQINLFDAFIVALDSRTSDNSKTVLHNLIPTNVPYHIFNHTFRNFGHSRTLVLSEANSIFSNITHIFMIDPDWKPNIDSINKNDLDLDIDAYQFKIWDRSGFSTRQSNWLAKNQPNLTFAYYIHEDFHLPNGRPPNIAKPLKWEVYEIEPNISWHNNVGHGTDSTASRSHARYYFDLDFLMKEQNDTIYKDSAHTLFYLGLTHAAILEGMDGYKSPYLHPTFELNPQMQYHLDKHLTYLHRLIDLHIKSIYTEYVYLSLRWLAYAYQFLLRRPQDAIRWYDKCIQYCPDRVDCKIELSRLYSFSNNHTAAWTLAVNSLQTELPAKAWTHNYMYDCITPLQASRSAINLMSIDNYKHYNKSRLIIGYWLSTEAKEKCKITVFEPEDIFEQLHYAYDTVKKEMELKDNRSLKDMLNDELRDDIVKLKYPWNNLK